MGYEFKFKESEARMKLLYTLGALLFLSTSVMAQQELNPTVPLPVEPVPEVEQAPEVSPWRQINRVITCNSLGIVRNILETNGQTIYATGYKTPEYLPMDPFDGVIITRNEIRSPSASAVWGIINNRTQSPSVGMVYHVVLLFWSSYDWYLSQPDRLVVR